MPNEQSMRLAAGAILGCLLTACVRSPAFADVHLPAIESDNMVLQLSPKSSLFGSATPGEKISITYGGRTVSTTTESNGQWHAALTKLKAGESFDIVISGKNTLTIKNVLVGQVWLCSGQSNMEFPLKFANDHDKELAQASHNEIRLFHVKHRMATSPLADVDGSWSLCDPASAKDFSAVGYFFGRALNQDLKTPVGLIEASYAGTPAQTWTSLEGLEADPATQHRYWLMAPAQLTALHNMSEAYEKTLADWKANDKSNGQDKPPAKPHALDFPYAPTMLFNGMIAPLTPSTIGGVIWYQGESNANNSDESMAYRSLFPALIKDWRKQFNLPDLPFLFVQLANFEKKEDPNQPSPWAELREAQLLTLSLPHTGMAVAVDIGDGGDIHPKNKQDVGKRLERIAMAEVYGKEEPFSGPIFSHLEIKDDKAICAFKYTDQGLKTKNGGPVVGFLISGADKKFYKAEAVISGNTVVVSSPKVRAPVAVRYAWAGDPPNNLYNGVGLPASPFRSDVPPEPAIVPLPATK